MEQELAAPDADSVGPRHGQRSNGYRLHEIANGSGEEEKERDSNECSKKCRSWMNQNWKSLLVITFLLIAYSLGQVAFSLMSPFFPQIASSKGASPFLIGVILGCTPLAVVLLSPVLGYLLPHIGLSLMVFVGLLLIGCSYTALAFVTLLPVGWPFVVTCASLRILEGVGTAFLSTATFSTFPQLFPKHVSTLVGLFGLSGGVGRSAGRICGGILYQYGGYRVPFLTVGGAVLLFVIPCTLLVWRMVTTSGKHEKKKSISARIVRQLSTDTLFISLVMIVAVGYCSLTYFVPGLPSFLQNEYHQTPLLISMVYFIGSFTYLIISVPTGAMIGALGNSKYFSVSGLFILASGHLMFAVPYFNGLKNIWCIRGSYVILTLGSAMTVMPVYENLLAIGRRYMGPKDNPDALSSFVSGIISAGLNLSCLQAQISGGLMSTYLPLPMCALVLAEVMIASAIMLFGLSVIDHYTHHFIFRKIN